MNLSQYKEVSAQAFAVQPLLTREEWDAYSVHDQRDYITRLAMDEESALNLDTFQSSFQPLLNALNKCTHLDRICDSCDELCKADMDEDFNEFCEVCILT